MGRSSSGRKCQRRSSTAPRLLAGLACAEGAGAAYGPAVAHRIVVVDNDPDALELVVLDLSLEGIEVVGTAQDGATALRLVAELAPDVLVVDHRMPPGPNGIDVAAEVRASHPETAVVLYSNYQSDDLLARSAALGVRFVPKGNLRTLRRAVQGA